MIDSLSASVTAPDAVDDVAIWVAVLFALWIGGPFFFQLAKLSNVYLVPHLRVAIKAHLFQHLMGHAPHYFQDNLPGRIAQKLTQAANSGQGVMIMLTIELVQTIVLTITACLLIGTLSASYGILAAAGHNLRLVLRRLALLFARIPGAVVDILAAITGISPATNAPAA